MPCFFCETEENLSQCPHCKREVCFEDLCLSHPKQMRFQWNGGPANYLICYSCRLAEDFGAELYKEKDPPPDDHGEKQSGVIYTPTPIAISRFDKAAKKAVDSSLLELAALKTQFEEQRKLARNLELFFQTKRFIIEHEIIQRTNTIKKRRDRNKEARGASAPPKRKSQPPARADKLMQMAIALAKSGITPAQVLELLKRSSRP